MTKRQYFGIILAIIGLIIYSIIFRESIIEYTSFDRLLLLSTVFMIPIGTFYLLYGIKRNYRIICSLIILGCMMNWSVEAAPLSVLPIKNMPNIDISRFTFLNETYGEYMRGGLGLLLSYGIFYGGSAAILWVFLGLLYYIILKDKFQNYGK
jgi:dolichol kinase